MGRIKWQEELDWTDEHIDDLRDAGFSYIRQGKYDIALPFFQTLTILNTDEAYDSQTLGAIYLQLNKPAKAVEYLDRALQLEADHGPTLLNMTKALIMLGKTDEALKLADILKNEKDTQISNPAKALLLAYS